MSSNLPLRSEAGREQSVIDDSPVKDASPAGNRPVIDAGSGFQGLRHLLAKSTEIAFLAGREEQSRVQRRGEVRNTRDFYRPSCIHLGDERKIVKVVCQSFDNNVESYKYWLVMYLE